MAEREGHNGYPFCSPLQDINLQRKSFAAMEFEPDNDTQQFFVVNTYCCNAITRSDLFFFGIEVETKMTPQCVCW